MILLKNYIEVFMVNNIDRHTDTALLGIGAGVVAYNCANNAYRLFNYAIPKLMECANRVPKSHSCTENVVLAAGAVLLGTALAYTATLFAQKIVYNSLTTQQPSWGSRMYTKLTNWGTARR